MNELEEIQQKISRVLDEIELHGHQRHYQPLETNMENALFLLYVISIATPVLHCKDKNANTFNRQLVREKINKLIAEKAEKHAYFVFNLMDVLKTERAVEHLKYIMSVGTLYLPKNTLEPS